MQIRIEAFDLPGRTCVPAPGFPGYRDIHVAVHPRARDGQPLAPQPGDAPSAFWTLDCTARRAPAGVDLTGPWIQGRPGQRFIYLTWNGTDATGTTTTFRRAKLMLDAVDPSVAEAALDRGLLIARVGLTDAHGHPLCAAVRPPTVTWSPPPPP
ncbi:hypothetical protein EDD96_7086 [Streptomyces sp. Ag109_G2-6]|uniref:DUF5990 family protein n=1 Tax=Streptomyces TaxID=1883 RepID=UPI0009A52711|nr:MULTISPECIES: DUF5990 family protein [Streptomyces]RPF25563.1 hypothetical protein EDD96_7086 [Streptomyces sp. Ag109_G2-6]